MHSLPRIRPLLILAALLPVAACSDTTEPEALHNFAVTGNQQVGEVGEPLPETVEIELRRPDGTPLQSFDVIVSAIAGDATVVVEGASTLGGDGGEVGVTVEDGVLELEITLATVPAAVAIEVRAPGIATNPAVVSIAAYGAPGPVTDAALAGDGQLGGSGDELSLPIAVVLTDRYGNAVPAVEVTWTAGEDAGSADPATSTTNGSGVAATSWRLGPFLGEQFLEAGVPGLGTLRFRATAVATGG